MVAIETPEIMADKVKRANALLADQRAALLAALAILRADRLGRLQVATALKLLRKVRGWQADMARAPEFHAPLVLGFMGDNGWGPLIRQTCADAPTLAGVAA